MSTPTPRHPNQVRVGDRLNHAGVIVVVDEIVETSHSWRIHYTYEAAPFTGGILYVSKDARYYKPVLRCEN